jgi:hypothetical protein
MKFEVGTLCRVKSLVYLYPKFRGKLCEIKAMFPDTEDIYVAGVVVNCKVSVFGLRSNLHDGLFHAHTSYLVPIEPDVDDIAFIKELELDMTKNYEAH